MIILPQPPSTLPARMDGILGGRNVHEVVFAILVGSQGSQMRILNNRPWAWS
ncbi:hypothetical protein [Kitasatospora kifunensis]